MERYIKTGVKFLFSFFGIFILWYLFNGEFDEIAAIIKSADIFYFLLGLFLFLFSTFFGALRLRRVLHFYGIDIHVLNVVKLNFIGYFFNIFLPSSVGGDLGKVYYIHKAGGDKGKAFFSVVTDRSIGLITIIFTASVAMLFQYRLFDNVIIPRIMAILFTAGAVVFFLIVFPKNIILLAEFFKIKTPGSLREAVLSERTLYPAFFPSLFFQLMSIVAIYFAGISIGIELSFYRYLLLLPLVYLFSLVPSINGLGVRESAFVFFFGTVIAREKAFALSILFDFIIYSESLIGFVFYLLNREKQKK